jgi:hypothetical protein
MTPVRGVLVIGKESLLDAVSFRFPALSEKDQVSTMIVMGEDPFEITSNTRVSHEPQ